MNTSEPVDVETIEVETINRHSDVVFSDDGVDMGKEKVEKTYKTYLEEKKLKQELENENKTETNKEETTDDDDDEDTGDTSSNSD